MVDKRKTIGEERRISGNKESGAEMSKRKFQ